MNEEVRPGDTCQVVDPGTPAHGYIVVAMHDIGRCGCGRKVFVIDPPLPVDPPPYPGAGPADACCSRILRPYRPGDGEDEILRIAGKPNETPADVIHEAAQ